MTDQFNKRQIHVFPPRETGDNGLSSAESGCACGSASTESSMGLNEMLTVFTEDYSDKAEVRTADYSSEQARSEAINALNRVLETSNESLRATHDNLDLILSQSAPIIAIDGIVIAAKNVPSVEQLAKVVNGELENVPTSSGCC